MPGEPAPSDSIPTATRHHLEMRRKPIFLKTRLCQDFTDTRSCRNGTGCNLAHGRAELRGKVKPSAAKMLAGEATGSSSTSMTSQQLPILPFKASHRRGSKKNTNTLTNPTSPTSIPGLPSVGATRGFFVWPTTCIYTYLV